LATQRITIAKVGGIAGDVIVKRMREWSLVRTPPVGDEWSPEQWRADVRKQADEFAEQLRMHGFAPPVIHFIEWVDMWSMGNLFGRWLTPPDGPPPLAIHADRFEIFACALPDGERLSQFLAAAGPQQWTETDWFVGRLHEAVGAWQELVERAVVVVLRHVVDGSALDEEVTASLNRVPKWLC
jgi:hypothetical protein